MKALITGFEPFGDHEINPSQQLIQTLPDQYQGIHLVKAVLPVHHQLGPKKLIELVLSNKPNAVIAFGLAAGRAKISLERIAINLLDYPIADNTGVTIENQPIIAEEPAAYFSTLPLQEMLTALTAAGVPAELSLTAGSYLCNQVFYTLMHTIAAHDLKVQAGFIHLPALAEQAATSKKAIPSLSFDQMYKAAQLIMIQLNKVS